MSARKEGKVELAIEAEAKAQGGEYRKLKFIARNGAPDKMCLLPGGIVAFIEAKAPGEKPERHQIMEMNSMRALGVRCTWVNSKEEAKQAVIDATLLTEKAFNHKWPVEV